MRVINEPELEVSLTREDIKDLFIFFNDHMLVPKYIGRTYPVFDSFVKIFDLLIEEERDKE